MPTLLLTLSLQIWKVFKDEQHWSVFDCSHDALAEKNT